MKKVLPIMLLGLGGLFALMAVAFSFLLQDPGLTGLGRFMGTVGGLLLVIGITLLLFQRARTKRLRERGHVLCATVVEAQIDYRTQVNHAPALILVCRGTDPRTGQSHLFSAKLWSTVVPQESLRGYLVDVLFDPQRPSVFDVQLHTLRRNHAD